MNIPLDNFFYLSTDALCVIDKFGAILAVSPSISRILSSTEAELMAKNFADLLYEDDKENFVASLRQMTTNREITFENRLVAKDGTHKLFAWKMGKGEDTPHLFLLGRDITNEMKVEGELKAQNRKIAEAKARNEAMIGSIGEGVVATSDKGEVIFVNEQALNILGKSLPDMMGMHLLKAILLVDEAKSQLPLEKHPMQKALLTGKKVFASDIYFVKNDGTNFPVAVTTSPVFLQGALIGGVLVFRDITLEKQIDRMKTEFISLASHQLRTPLSAMKWFSEMLLAGDAGELSGEQKEMVNNIYLSNERMIDLVNSLLNISRIESGRIIVDPRPTSLRKVVDEVIFELTPKISKKKHILNVETGELPEINIDPKLIRHVYMNLLTNAIKYTQEGGNISIKIYERDQEIISEIKDNGYGIPKSQYDKVFKKFFRANNIVRFETDGSGLGLYLIKAIIDASGGRIWFESEEGKGTAFYFGLPLSGSKSKEGEVSINS